MFKTIQVTNEEERILTVMRNAAAIQGDGKITPEIAVMKGQLCSPDSEKLLNEIHFEDEGL